MEYVLFFYFLYELGSLIENGNRVGIVLGFILLGILNFILVYC